MHRWVKIFLWFLGVLIGLLVLLYSAGALYIHFNKKELLSRLTNSVNHKINGTISIKDVDPSFFVNSPDLSVKLEEVELRDSLWHKHQHPLLKSREVYVSLNALGFIRGLISVSNIHVKDAECYIFTDSTGYSNASLFKIRTRQRKTTDKQSGNARLSRLSAENVRLIVDNRPANKMFRFDLRRYRGHTRYHKGYSQTRLNVDMVVRDMAFNKEKGSFLKDKSFKGSFQIRSNAASGAIDISPADVKIGEDDFRISAYFQSSLKPARFVINVESRSLKWRNASALLARNIAKKLNMYDLEKPVSVRALLVGDFGPGSNPAIDVQCKVEDNVLHSPGGDVAACSFVGMFTNHLRKGGGNTDENSRIRIIKFSGIKENIPLKMDSLLVTNLLRPDVKGNVRSDFHLRQLDALFSKAGLRFKEGNASVNLGFAATVEGFEIVRPYVTGTIHVKKADIDYKPRGLNFKSPEILLNFTPTDLILNNISLQSDKSVINLKGRVRNFMNLYYEAPERMVFDCEVYSREIHPAAFLGLLGDRKTISDQREPSAMIRQLNRALEKSTVNMNVRLDKAVYKNFIATGTRANFRFGPEGLDINSLDLKHAGGTLSARGTLRQAKGGNRFNLNARVNSVNVRDFFYAFNNFGLEALSYRNLRGVISANTNISGSIREGGELVPRSLAGLVTFDLNKGALLNFTPLNGVGKIVFPFRDLSNITFERLKGRFDVSGEKIRISPMQINSSVLNMDISGIYSLGKGTDIDLDIPLRNPKKDAGIVDRKEKASRRMKGLVLHLEAVDGDDGKIKIQWNKGH